MRCFGWAAALSVILSIQAANANAGCAACAGNDGGSYRAYRGSACLSPPGYSLAPGCCICPPSACDNAWDGYCQEKAKWQAFFTTVGTPKAHCYRCPCMQPCETYSTCTETQQTVEPQKIYTPKPANPPTPAPPLPSKTTWKAVSPAYR
jgi:hypothetical protein